MAAGDIVSKDGNAAQEIGPTYPAAKITVGWSVDADSGAPVSNKSTGGAPHVTSIPPEPLPGSDMAAVLVAQTATHGYRAVATVAENGYLLGQTYVLDAYNWVWNRELVDVVSRDSGGNENLSIVRYNTLLRRKAVNLTAAGGRKRITFPSWANITRLDGLVIGYATAALPPDQTMQMVINAVSTAEAETYMNVANTGILVENLTTDSEAHILLPGAFEDLGVYDTPILTVDIYPGRGATATPIATSLYLEGRGVA